MNRECYYTVSKFGVQKGTSDFLHFMTVRHVLAFSPCSEVCRQVYLWVTLRTSPDPV